MLKSKALEILINLDLNLLLLLMIAFQTFLPKTKIILMIKENIELKQKMKYFSQKEIIANFHKLVLVGLASANKS